MPEAPQRVYWDSCIFLAYVNGEPGRVEVVSGLLESGTNGELAIFTSDLSQVEVAFSATEKEKQSLDSGTELLINGLWEGAALTMVDFHPGIANLAKSLMRHAIANGWSMRANDAIHLATAQWLDTNGFQIDEFHTFDSGLVKFAGIAGFEVCLPYNPRPRLLS